MKISYNWLKQYSNINLSAQEIAKILTYCGLEVSAIEKFETVKGGLDGLLLGEVITKVQHPNADKLSLTTVDAGNGKLLKIVCGAPNVAAGQKVVVATVGATIFPLCGDEIKIKKTKIRGEESEGMICSEDEIGLGNSHDGIMVLNPDAKPGTPAKEYFKVEADWIFEIELTPNRIDAASHIGVARDLLAVINLTHPATAVRYPVTENFKVGNIERKIEVLVENAEACLRYSGITLTGVQVKESPQWLKNRLLSIGQKPINNIVDITNFVLHECGQPLHAFDIDSITGDKIIVKTLPPGTKFITLDGKERELYPEDLMICNETEALCIAGVFGGIKSGVSAKTKNIFLESAYFNPRYIRKTAKRHDLHTEASFRFERGSDPNITVFALKRAALLIKEIAGGAISSEIVDFYPKPVKNAVVEFAYEYCTRLIGKKIERNIIKNILSSLEISIEQEAENKLILSVPTFKADVLRPADMVEEVLRIYGYNNIEMPQQLRVSMNTTPKPDKHKIQNIVSDFLADNGFREIMCNSLTQSGYYNSPAQSTGAQPVKILNPLSADLNVMRQTLLFNGLETIAYNKNRKNDALKLYEFGNVYSVMKEDGMPAPDLLKERKMEEKNVLALFLTGRKHAENWNLSGKNSDFFDLKETVENILKRLDIKPEIKKEIQEPQYMKDTLHYTKKGKTIVVTGLVRSSLLTAFDIKQEVIYAEFYWNNILDELKKNKITYHETSKFPSVRRDLAILLDQNTKYSDVEKIAFETEKNLLRSVTLFDVFEDKTGEKIPAGKKSYAVSFTFLDERKTLNDTQIDKMMERLMNACETKLGAQIRTV